MSSFAAMKVVIDSIATIDFISFVRAWASSSRVFVGYISAADPNY